MDACLREGEFSVGSYTTSSSDELISNRSQSCTMIAGMDLAVNDSGRDGSGDGVQH